MQNYNYPVAPAMKILNIILESNSDNSRVKQAFWSKSGDKVFGISDDCDILRSHVLPRDVYE